MSGVGLPAWDPADTWTKEGGEGMPVCGWNGTCDGRARLGRTCYMSDSQHSSSGYWTEGHASSGCSIWPPLPPLVVVVVVVVVVVLAASLPRPHQVLNLLGDAAVQVAQRVAAARR